MVCTVPTDELDFESNTLIVIGKAVRYMDICNLMAIDADASEETLNRRGRVVLKWEGSFGVGKVVLQCEGSFAVGR